MNYANAIHRVVQSVHMVAAQATAALGSPNRPGLRRVLPSLG